MAYQPAGRAAKQLRELSPIDRDDALATTISLSSLAMAPQKRPLSTFQALRAATLQALPPARPAAKRRRTVARASTDGSSDDDADFAPLSSSRVAAASSSSATPRAKRSRAQGLTVDGSSSGRAFGVQSSDDTFVSSSNGVCVRPPPRASLPSLQRCALQSLSRGVKRLYLPDAKGGGLRLDVEDLLRQLPDHLKMLVWDVLLDTGSGFLHLNTISKVRPRPPCTRPALVRSLKLTAAHSPTHLRAPVLCRSARGHALGQPPRPVQPQDARRHPLPQPDDLAHAHWPVQRLGRLGRRRPPQNAQSGAPELAVRLPRSSMLAPRLEHRGSADLDGPSRALCSVGSGSTLVSQKTALALQSAAGGLRSLNLSETAIRVPDLQPLLLAAQRLGTLKLANIKGVVRSRFLLRSPSFATRGTDGARGDQLPQTDPALGKLLDVLYADVGPSRKGPSVAAVRPLAALKTLKLRGNVRSGCSISALRAAGARD